MIMQIYGYSAQEALNRLNPINLCEWVLFSPCSGDDSTGEVDTRIKESVCYGVLVLSRNPDHKKLYLYTYLYHSIPRSEEPIADESTDLL